MGKKLVLTIKRSALPKIVSLLFIMGVSAYAIFITRGIWTAGSIIHGDHAFRILLLKCLEDTSKWVVPGAWCPYLTPLRESFTFFPPLFSLLVVLFSFVLNVDIAYKLVLILVWFFVPAVAFFILYDAKKYYAAAASFSLLLFLQANAHNLGFNHLFIWGGMNQVLGLGFLLINLRYAFTFFKNPTKQKLLIFSLLGMIHVLAHILYFTLFIIALAFLIIPNFNKVKSNWKLFVAYPIIVFLLVSFLVLPLAFQTQFTKGNNTLYTDKKPVFGINNLKESWNNITLLPIVKLFGFIGLAVFIYKKNFIGSILRLALLIIITAILVSLIVPQASVFLNPGRLAQFLTVILLITTGLLLEWVASFNLKRNKAMKIFSVAKWGILLIFFIFVLRQHITATKAGADYIYPTEDGRFGFKMNEVYKSVNKAIEDKRGRLLVQDFFYHEVADRHKASPDTILASIRLWMPLAIISKKDTFSVYPTYRTLKSQPEGITKEQVLMGIVQPGHVAFFNEPFDITTEKKAMDVLGYLNANYVLTNSPSWKRSFSSLPIAWSRLGFDLFYKNGSLPYFEFLEGSGYVMHENYEHTSAEAVINASVPSVLLFKQSIWPNWKAYVNGVPTEIFPDALGFMVVKIPAGEQIITFSYEMLWYEYLGYALSLLGVVLLLSLFMLRKRII